jgi:hypothetical protein
MLSSWLFYPSFCCRLPEGRKVSYEYILYKQLMNIIRHMNIDYSICQALKHQTQDMTGALVNYDVACQWSVNFLKRVQENVSGHLSIPNGLEIIPAVGKFHLGAHIPECFPLFSLNFVHGAGQQDGEILETLWSSLNKVSGSIRAMSKAHRHEVLDDYMRDSNWKKLIGMSELISQYLIS